MTKAIGAQQKAYSRARKDTDISFILFSPLEQALVSNYALNEGTKFLGGGSMYKFGPELDPETLLWLRRGPELPAAMTVQLNGSDTERHYEILDRDANGIVSALRTGRCGKKGFVLKVRDLDSGEIQAAKLCIPEDYASTTPVTELDFARALRDIEQLVLLPKLLGSVARFPGEPRESDTARWVCFISEWLDGFTLRDLIDTHPNKVTPQLVAKVAKDLLTAVLVMEEMGYKHDDLNLGNIMIQEPNRRLASINPAMAEPRLRVIDLGSMKPVDRRTSKPDDDWSLSAKCLADLHNAMHENRPLASQYPQFLKSLRDFIFDLSDEPSRKFPVAGDYIKRINRIEQLISIEPRTGTNFHPLEAISAEHLADDAILLELFVKHLPWLSLVQSPNPCVLIGPRGCGKSMVFRYMATKTHITSRESRADVLNDTGMFGVYVGCSSDLGHDLVWLSGEGKVIGDYVDQVTDYFNIVASRELMRALASAASASDFSTALGFNEHGKRGIVDFFESAFSNAPRRLYVSGMEYFQSCADFLDSLRITLARNMRSGAGPGYGTGATFLRDLTGALVANFPALQKYRITFLLDDYTENRISRPVQSILNGIIFARVGTMMFKVSSEPYGFDTATFFGTRVDPTREYVEIDAGTKCLEMSPSERRIFVTDLLDRRLKTAKYQGTADILIGDSEYRTDPKLAEAIKTKRKGMQTHYNGLDVLSNAWSGDVATVLHIVSNMFADASVDAASDKRISNVIQHNAIVRVSKGLRGRVQSFSPYGQEMGNILTAFGDLAGKLLIEHKAKTRGGSDELNRKYRIEWTLPEGSDVETELAAFDPRGNLYCIYKELVRRAVFHEHLESRGKEGPGRRTVRLQVRSSLLPSFGVSLIHENHINIPKADDFVEFLSMPKRWADSVLARYRTPQELLGNLFTAEGS